MKLKKIKLNSHSILKDLEVNFCDNQGNALNTIVVIGENGVGKTTLLKTIFQFMNVDEKEFQREGTGGLIKNRCINLELDINNDEFAFLQRTFIQGDIENQPVISKVVYMPAEINFDHLKKVDNTFKTKESFLNTVNQSIAGNIPSFIVDS